MVKAFGLTREQVSALQKPAALISFYYTGASHKIQGWGGQAGKEYLYWECHRIIGKICRNRWKSGEKKAEYVENFCTGFLSSAVFGDRRLCAAGKKSSEQHELEIKIVTEEEIPEELMSLIEKNKKNPFRLTFADQGKLYLAEGYGEQKTTGYSVEVDRLCETQEAVHIHTGLLGPEKEKKKGDCNLSLCSSGTRRDRKNIRFE